MHLLIRRTMVLGCTGCALHNFRGPHSQRGHDANGCRWNYMQLGGPGMQVLIKNDLTKQSMVGGLGLGITKMFLKMQISKARDRVGG